jgi:hypothetical protein
LLIMFKQKPAGQPGIDGQDEWSLVHVQRESLGEEF